jgi:GTP-binding protein HflX
MLLDAVGNRLRRKALHGVMRLQPAQGRQRAQLFEIGAVLNEEVCEDGGWILELKMAERDLQRFLKRENLADDLLEPLPAAKSATAANLK